MELPQTGKSSGRDRHHLKTFGAKIAGFGCRSPWSHRQPLLGGWQDGLAWPDAVAWGSPAQDEETIHQHEVPGGLPLTDLSQKKCDGPNGYLWPNVACAMGDKLEMRGVG